MVSLGTCTSGYDEEFLDPPAKLKEYECPLCLLVTREPNQTSCCGQDFCQSCINRVLTDRKPCPLCKVVNFSIFLDKKQMRKVLELKVRCPVRGRGCDWTGELGALSTHTDTQNGKCQFVDVICPNNCGESHQRRHLDSHLSDTCQNREYTCVYCNYESTYELVIKHYDQCANFPLECHNGCEMGVMERIKMAEHLSECPLQLLDCEYAQAGCSEKIQRKDLAMHMEQNVQKHLLWVFTASQKRIAALEDMQRKAEEQAEAMRRQTAEKDRQIELLKNRVGILEMHAPVGILHPEFTVPGYSRCVGAMAEEHSFILYTRPREVKLQVDIYFGITGLRAHLYQLPGEFDDEIQAMVACTVTVLLLNQLSDENNINTGYQALMLGKKLKKTCLKKFGVVPYSVIEDCSTRGVGYLRDDCVKLKIIVDIEA